VERSEGRVRECEAETRRSLDLLRAVKETRAFATDQHKNFIAQKVVFIPGVWVYECMGV